MKIRVVHSIMMRIDYFPPNQTGRDHVSFIFTQSYNIAITICLDFDNMDIIFSQDGLDKDWRLREQAGFWDQPSWEFLEAFVPHNRCGGLSELTSDGLIRIVLEIPESTFYLTVDLESFVPCLGQPTTFLMSCF